MEIKRLSDQMMNESFTRHTQGIYILPASEVFYIYFHYGRKRTFWKKASSAGGQQLISGSKYSGQMDIGEKRKAQLDTFTHSLERQEARLRLSSVGGYLQRGSLMTRLLYGAFETPHCYFSSRDFATILQRAVRRGLYLFSGPVGSGKTPLMYRLALEERLQVTTIEDLVGIEEPFFLQLQINPKIAQTYDTLLRFALQHRPDSLIIGEIRDESTAHTTVRATLTGHRVFATVHARNLEGTLVGIHELTKKEEELSECLVDVIYQELLEDANHHPSVLQNCQFMEEESVEKSQEESYEEAQGDIWQSELF